MMNLQQQIVPNFAQILISTQFHHSCYDHVSCSALDRCIYSSTEPMPHHLFLLACWRQMFGEVPVASEQSLSPAFFQGDSLHIFLPASDLRPISIPHFYCFTGFLLTTVPIFHETMHSFPICDTEI